MKICTSKEKGTCTYVVKTQMMIICRKRREPEPNDVRITVSEHEVERKKYTYVKSSSVYLGDSLKWYKRVNTICRKCWAGLASLKQFRKVLSVSLKKKLYNCMILPHLLLPILQLHCIKSME